MTLFIIREKRQVEINDFYIMLLVFIIIFWITRLKMKALEKNNKKTVAKLRGGIL